ncbi:hypothetical protein [Nonomuraea jabiensis]|uniref:Uncharacterized protein n=1 Tax=Nonomuraea jabiensis TaxID=882448 RepID=A0A7W9LIJ8_9ACTN|nr:hypothetical protein [Nonomuraea jabiensis]MBB5785038.1 hypothetical protein [Nonomuraea jabiensis]
MANTFAAGVFPSAAGPGQGEDRAALDIQVDAVEQGAVMAEPFMGATIADRADIRPLPG